MRAHKKKMQQAPCLRVGEEEEEGAVDGKAGRRCRKHLPYHPRPCPLLSGQEGCSTCPAMGGHRGVHRLHFKEKIFSRHQPHQLGKRTWHSLLTWLRLLLVRLFSESLLPLESRSMPFRFRLACFLAA